MINTVTGIECPDCDSEGPHSYWPEDNAIECGNCACEFEPMEEQLASMTIK
jgi:Zn ribbon nucleic-acid-binding protein